MSRKVSTLSGRVEAIKLHDGGKSSWDVAQIMGVGRTQIQQIIKRKSEVLDHYESNISNNRKRKSFNSGIFVILKKLWTLNYKSPLLSSQFLPALKWLLKSSLTVLYTKSYNTHTHTYITHIYIKYNVQNHITCLHCILHTVISSIVYQVILRTHIP